MTSIAQLIEMMHSDDPPAAFSAQRRLRSLADEATRGGASDELTAALVAELGALASDHSADPAANIGYGKYLRQLQAKNKTAAESQSALPPKHSASVRRLLCELIGQIGSDAEVPALAGALNDPAVRDSARCALERIGSKAATAALSESLRQFDPQFRIGVLNSLGPVRTPAVVDLLLVNTTDSRPEIRAAVYDALARIADPAGDVPLTAAVKAGSPRERVQAAKARFRLAMNLRKAGNQDAANAILRSLAADSLDGPWKNAARKALT